MSVDLVFKITPSRDVASGGLPFGVLGQTFTQTSIEVTGKKSEHPCCCLITVGLLHYTATFRQIAIGEVVQNWGDPVTVDAQIYAGTKNHEISHITLFKILAKKLADTLSKEVYCCYNPQQPTETQCQERAEKIKTSIIEEMNKIEKWSGDTYHDEITKLGGGIRDPAMPLLALVNAIPAHRAYQPNNWQCPNP